MGGEKRENGGWKVGQVVVVGFFKDCGIKVMWVWGVAEGSWLER